MDITGSKKTNMNYSKTATDYLEGLEYIRRNARQLDKLVLGLADVNKPADEILGGYTKEQWAGWYAHTSNKEREIARMEFENIGEPREDDEDHDDEKIPPDEMESPSEAEKNGQY